MVCPAAPGWDYGPPGSTMGVWWNWQTHLMRSHNVITKYE